MPVSERRDGFFFVGGQVAIDFVNTRLMSDGSMELLPDPPALARWLRAAGLIDDATMGRLLADWTGSAAARRALERLKEFREAVRATLFRIEGGEGPSRPFVAALNQLLAEHPMRTELHRGRSGLERRRTMPMAGPDDAVAPIAEAAAVLLTEADRSRIRQCEGCVAHFVDTSKGGLRRWCSMRLCGNRAKVAAYADRHGRDRG